MKSSFMKNLKKFLNGGPKGLIIFVTIFVFGLALLSGLTEFSQNTSHLATTDFLEAVKKGQVESVVVSGQDVYGQFKDGGQKFQSRIAKGDNQFMDELREAGVKGDVASGATSLGYVSNLLGLLFPLIAIVLLFFFLFKMFKSSGSSQGGPGSGIFSFGKSRAKLTLPSMVKDRFSDVAGAEEAKDDLRDIIDFLRKPEQFQRMGAKVPRGVLLVGDPGNGKTLLARAVAGEAGVPFFSITGSDFIEVFVGVGASRVRDLFEQARKQSPCIVFIDEIDAIGRHRGSGLGGGHDEREQTLNQLLTELDGFDTSKAPVIIMGATNIPEVLDKALLRPGRFDRQVEIPYPELKDREEILRIHSRNKKFGVDVDLQQIAIDTSGFTGADLANLMNVAAISASRGTTGKIENADLARALKKVRMSKDTSQLTPSLLPKGGGHARMFMPSQIKYTFADVAGLPEAKEELQDIIVFLKEPERFTRVGARVPHGVLLVGDPGNGKTLLAKAIAGEAKCPFFAASGSEFIEQYVGVGASRVRELFNQAKKHAPCIIFIDEIDSVGGRRHAGDGGTSEYAQTLNQLLTEMDGFESSEKPIIVVGATNRADMLDSALLRPGRFDRQVHVPYPSIEVREEVLRVHTKNKKIDPTVDLSRVARGTPGFSAAQLANVANEAALIAVNDNRDTVTMLDFEEARDKVMLGKQQKTIKQTRDELNITAYHESGHSLINLLLPEHADPLHKITILPRGGALGITYSLPERDRYLVTKDQMLAEIKILLGGRAAEDVVFNTVTTGASSDFNRASDMARKMVCQYGMSDLGQVTYGQSYRDFQYSEKTRERIDQEVHAIISHAYEEAKQLLQAHRDKLDTLAKVLLQKETMYASEVYALLGITPREDHALTSGSARSEKDQAEAAAESPVLSDDVKSDESLDGEAHATANVADEH
jgi:cell division protease FtsH